MANPQLKTKDIQIHNLTEESLYDRMAFYIAHPLRKLSAFVFVDNRVSERTVPFLFFSYRSGQLYQTFLVPRPIEKPLTRPASAVLNRVERLSSTLHCDVSSINLIDTALNGDLDSSAC